MIVVNNRILVKVNMEQKSKMIIGDTVISTALLYESNFREKSPTIAVVVSGNDTLKEGDILVVHHNHFYPPSPYFVQDDLFSIPFNHTIFGKFDKEGNLTPLCNNVFGTRVDIPSNLLMPSDKVTTYDNRVLVTNGRGTKYKKGETVFTTPSAPYDIVYNFNLQEKRVTKVNQDFIVGVKSI